MIEIYYGNFPAIEWLHFFKRIKYFVVGLDLEDVGLAAFHEQELFFVLEGRVGLRIQADALRRLVILAHYRKKHWSQILVFLGLLKCPPQGNLHILGAECHARQQSELTALHFLELGDFVLGEGLAGPEEEGTEEVIF